MDQVKQVLQTVKGLLKQHKINYAQVASHLNLSESSVKRSFSQGQISLGRLIKICELMDLDFLDLLQVMQKENDEIAQLTTEQESVIVSDVKFLLVTVCVFNHWSFREIIETYEIEEAELIKMLLGLEKNDFLMLLPDNKIKLKISANFHWIEKGPVQAFFEKHIQQDFWQSQFIGAGEIRLLANGMLSKASNEFIQKQIKRLQQQFNQMSEQDRHLSMDKRHGTSLLVGMRPWEMKLFEDLRRQENIKPYV